ncbi:hypothetical protein [Sphingobium xenophagum]|uniref:hypothetical protein n=1 Tax=Sphingobium xenophagum TaxID=121428 RepID=UPI0012FE7C09|nr:hypothetical protein [Sphingobium xenophagum]
MLAILSSNFGYFPRQTGLSRVRCIQLSSQIGQFRSQILCLFESCRLLKLALSACMLQRIGQGLFLGGQSGDGITTLARFAA